MAVPKRKTSKARRDKRRSNWKLSAGPSTRCPNCGAQTMPHRVCTSCGQYQGQQVIHIRERRPK